MKDYQ